MPIVATFDGIKIQFYRDEHPPPHFHAEYAEHVAVIDIRTLDVLEGALPKPQYRKVVVWARPRLAELMFAWSLSAADENPGADWMKRKLPGITSAEPVMPGVLKIAWEDGHIGVVDLRPVLARGKVFTYLQNPDNFQKVQVTEFGHSIEWLNESGEQIDFASGTLREKTEKQAALIALAS